jgi:hypothetical protein
VTLAKSGLVVPCTFSPLGVKNAFGSIDLARLLVIMEDLEYLLDTTEFISDKYNNSTTIYVG